MIENQLKPGQQIVVAGKIDTTWAALSQQPEWNT